MHYTSDFFRVYNRQGNNVNTLKFDNSFLHRRATNQDGFASASWVQGYRAVWGFVRVLLLHGWARNPLKSQPYTLDPKSQRTRARLIVENKARPQQVQVLGLCMRFTTATWVT